LTIAIEMAERRDVGWAAFAGELEALQLRLAEMRPPRWRPVADRPLLVAGVFAASATGLVGVGAVGDPLWAGAVAVRTDAPERPTSTAVIRGRANGPYVAGLLALRQGPLLEQAVRSLGERPDVVVVNGTGRDHPRRAGIAVHLGAVLDTPTVGVTVRPLLAPSVEPGRERGDAAGLVLDGEVVGSVVRTRRGARPVFAHAAWRTDAEVALGVIVSVTGRSRTPEPIRLARRIAREVRARDEGRAPHAGR
jgi:deoxyribonuclease V